MSSIGEIITELITNAPDVLIKMIGVPLLIIAVTIIGFVLLFKWILKFKKLHDSSMDRFVLMQKTDERFFKSKLIQMINPFDFILVSETGYLALKSHKMQEPKIIHIKDITGFEIVSKIKYPEDLKVVPHGLFWELRLLIAFMDKPVSRIKKIISSSLFRTVIRGLWFQFKTNDSLDPVIEITAIDMPYSRRRINAEYYQKDLLEIIKQLADALEKATESASKGSALPKRESADVSVQSLFTLSGVDLSKFYGKYITAIGLGMDSTGDKNMDMRNRNMDTLIFAKSASGFGFKISMEAISVEGIVRFNIFNMMNDNNLYLRTCTFERGALRLSIFNTNTVTKAEKPVAVYKNNVPITVTDGKGEASWRDFSACKKFLGMWI